MINRAVNVAIVDGKTVVETLELKGASPGHPIRIKAIAEGKYLLAEGEKGVAPQNITVKRVGKDLHVTLEGGDLDQPQLIIEGFFDAQGQLIGMAEDGSIHPYIASDAEQDHSAAFLIDGVSAPQVLATESMAGMGNGLTSASAFGGLGVLGAGLIGLAGLGLLGVAYAASNKDDDEDDVIALPPLGTPHLGGAYDHVGGKTGLILPGETTDDTSPTFTGTGNPGNTIIIRDGDKIIGEVIVGADGNWTFTPPVPLTEGSHNITFTERDSLGNESEPSPGLIFTIDITAPGKVSITDVLNDINNDPISPNGYTNDSTPTLKGQAEPGTTVEVFANGVKIGEAPVDASGNWTFTPTTPLADGSYVFTVVAVDPAGNRGLPSDPYPLTIDASGPGKPGENGMGAIDTVFDDVDLFVGPVGNGGLTNDNTPTLSGGQQQPGDTVTIRDNGVIIGSVIVDAQGNWTFTPETPLADGQHSLTMIVTDLAGNTSEPSDPYVIDVETSAPGKPGENGMGAIDTVFDDVILYVGPVDNGGLTNDNTPTISGGQQQPGNTVNILDNGVIIGSVLVQPDGTWTFTPETPLDDGIHEFTLVINDPAGNTSEPSDPYVIDVETSAPGKPGENGVGGIDTVYDDVDLFVGPVDNGGLTNDNTPTLSGGQQQPGDTVNIRDNGAIIGSVIVDAQGNWTFTPETPLADGRHDLTMTVTDPAGNTSEPSDPYVIDVETSAPGKPGADGNGGLDSVYDDVELGVGEIANGGITNDNNPTLSGGGQQPGDTVTITDNGTFLGSVLVQPDGTWTFTPETPLEDGTHEFILVINDPAGNTSEPSEPFTITIETEAPLAEATIDSMGKDGGVSDFVTNDGSAGRLYKGTLTATLAADEKVQVSSDGGATWHDAQVGVDGSWSYVDMTAHTNDWAIQVRVVDEAGNFNAVRQNVDLDTVAPTAPTSLEFNGSVVTVNFDGHGIKVGDTIQVVVGTQRFEVQLTQAQIDAGSANVTTVANAAMTNTSAMLIDTAGNASQYLLPVLETMDFEGVPTGGVPAGGVQDFGAFTFRWGITASVAPLGVLAPGSSWSGFTTPTVGLGVLMDPNTANPKIELGGGVEASAMSFVVGDIDFPVTLIFYGAGGAVVHTVSFNPAAGIQEVNFQLPNGETFTSVEFAGTTQDWLWLDNFKFSNGSFEHMDAPATQSIVGTGGYYGDEADNVFSLSNTAHLNDVSSVINGEGGLDTLKLTGAGQTLNLDNIAGKLQSIEVIDLSGTGNNTLNLSLGDVLEQGHSSLFIDDNHVQMMIKGNTGDVVNLNDVLSGSNDPGDWSAQGNVTVGGVVYNVYSHSTVDAELLVQQGVTTNLV